MSTIDDVQLFLQDFKAKLNIWGVIFRDDRGKNANALLDLDITPVYREKVLLELQVTDYIVKDQKRGPCMEEQICGFCKNN